jgi:hypothetical protein
MYDVNLPGMIMPAWSSCDGSTTKSTDRRLGGSGGANLHHRHRRSLVSDVAVGEGSRPRGGHSELGLREGGER